MWNLNVWMLFLQNLIDCSFSLKRYDIHRWCTEWIRFWIEEVCASRHTIAKMRPYHKECSLQRSDWVLHNTSAGKVSIFNMHVCDNIDTYVLACGIQPWSARVVWQLFPSGNVHLFLYHFCRTHFCNWSKTGSHSLRASPKMFVCLSSLTIN
jgi:hypothetical protein